jgi:predicted transcriptional regulator
MSVVFRLTLAETNLADIIWANAPIASSDLVKIAASKLGWKRTTTYTILKKLCTKGIAENTNAMVSALLTRDEFLAGQSRRFIDDTFEGSLPKFVAAFIGGEKLTQEQAFELRRLIEEHEEQ